MCYNTFYLGGIMEDILANDTKVFIYKNPSGWDGSFSDEYIEGTIIDSEISNNNDITYVILDTNYKIHVCLHNQNSFTTEFFRTEQEQLKYIKTRIKGVEKEIIAKYKEIKDLTVQRMILEEKIKQQKKHL